MHMLGKVSMGQGQVRGAVGWLRRAVRCLSSPSDFGRPPVAMRAGVGAPDAASPGPDGACARAHRGRG
eukprot:4665351-Prymnesium_polylepis.1